MSSHDLPPLGSSATAASPFEDLARLASSGSTSLAGPTLRVQSALFAQQAASGDADQGAFLKLALTLLPLADEVSAREAATRLSSLEATPPALVEAFIDRGGGSAEAVIEHAPRLPARLRRVVALHQDPRLAARLAGREDLDPEDQIHLLGRGEPAVSAALARNGRLSLSRPAASALLAMARSDAAVAQALLERQDIDLVSLAPLYAQAGAERRAAIRDEIEKRLAERAIMVPLREATAAERERLMDVSILGMAPLIDAAASVSERGEAFADAAAADPSRELVGLGLLTLGVSPEDATRMLLRTGDAIAQDSRRLHDLVGVLRAASRPVAAVVLNAAWPEAQPRAAQAQHIPAMAPGGTPERAGAARKAAKTGQATPAAAERARGARGGNGRG